MATKKKKAAKKSAKEEATQLYNAGQRVLVRSRGLEHVGTIGAVELRRGAYAYAITWSAEALARDPSLKGMRRVTDADILRVVGEAPVRELPNEGFAQRMAQRRGP
jgi:hypothetical protein